MSLDATQLVLSKGAKEIRALRAAHSALELATWFLCNLVYLPIDREKSGKASNWLGDSPHHGFHDQLADVLRPWRGTTNPPTVASGRLPKSAPKYAPAAAKKCW